MKRFALLYVLPSIGLMLLLVWPLVRGHETLILRDTLNVHYPMKFTQAQAMRQGYMPLIDPHRGGGQPLLGNPNSVPLYPDNLLYLVASPLWALNAHFWIHFLLAPFSFFWMARAWGLGRPASWIAGLCYGLSGFFLSQLNLYNLVVGVTLAPALVAACLRSQDSIGLAGSGGERRRSPALPLVMVGILWALLLLGGDPMLALQAAGLAATALLVRGGWRWVLTSWPILGALICGTFLAAPQLVEFLRILGLSYRGYWGFSPDWALMASWNPETLFEWFLPTLFGRPDLYFFWGRPFFAGHTPLFFSLYPGILVLVLVLASGRPRQPVQWWGWGAVLVGLFLALGDWNPLVRALMELPGAGLLRFPVKLWLLVAVGGGILCGVSLQSFVDGARRRLGLALASLWCFYAALWLALSALPGPVESAMRRLIPDNYTAEFVSGERVRWAGLCLLSVLALTALGIAFLQARRRPDLSMVCVALIHVVAQLVLLRFLLPTDRSEEYLRAPPLLASVATDELVAHGSYSDMFGKSKDKVKFPDGRLLWIERRGWNELYPFAGATRGRRYELNISPEGLDSFLTLATFQAMELLPDVDRVRVLKAMGVDVLLLDRELEPEALSLVRLRKRHPSFGQWIYLYEILGTAEEVQLLSHVVRAPHMNAGLGHIIDPGFDPRRTVVVPGEGPALEAEPGTVRVVARSPESLRVQVASDSPGVLVVQRAYLPLYRATIDGDPVDTGVANLSRLAVSVPAGRHEVRLWIDRRPARSSLAGIPLGIVGLWLLGRRVSRISASSDL